MEKGARLAAITVLMAIVHESVGVADPHDPNGTVAAGACQSQLRNLASYLEETAAAEGMALTVEWRTYRSVVLHFDEFSQYMRCRGGQMHVEYRDLISGDQR
jgi:hypothetical protein